MYSGLLLYCSLAISMFFTLANTARADFSGVRVNYGNVDIQFNVGDDKPSEQVRELLFGSERIVARLASLLSAQPRSSIDAPRDLTVEVGYSDGQYALALYSSTQAINSAIGDQSTRAASASAVYSLICDLLNLTDCNSRDYVPRNAVVGNYQQAPQLIFQPETDVVVTIGSLPTDDPDQQVALPDASGATTSARSKELTRTLETRSLEDAIARQADRAFFGDRSELLTEELRQDEPSTDELYRRSATRRYFVIHCTAFGASDASMEKWVNRNISDRRRNKSHGVILPSGKWLPMWPFAEMKVWATKTETCRETRSNALGSGINIELHYFCASNRQDHPTDEQYNKLAEIYSEVNATYGPLNIVTHREVDRGLRDGHSDPIKFDFEEFYGTLARRGIDVNSFLKITSARHELRTGPDISHHWPPTFSGPLVLESKRQDDCRRDH